MIIIINNNIIIIIIITIINNNNNKDFIMEPQSTHTGLRRTILNSEL